MNRITRLAIARPLVTVLFVVGLIALSAVGGTQVFDKLKSGGYSDPNSDSARATAVLEDTFQAVTPPLSVIADFGDDVDSAAVKTEAATLTDALAAYPTVKTVSSYYTLGSPAALKSTDGKAAYFFVSYLDGVDATAATKTIMDSLGSRAHGAQLYYQGGAAMAKELNGTIGHDIGVAETIAIPLSVVLLIFVFGSLVAAGLPLFVGGLSILGSFFFLWLAAQTTDVSVFAMNLITALALGLGIDYSLLIVNRFREQRQTGQPVREAVLSVMATAGRTVFFSGLTVSVVLAGLWMFPMYFLRSMGLAGVAVVIVALLLSLVALPALLILLGDRVNLLRVVRRPLASPDTGVLATISRFVMRNAVAVFVLTMLGIGGLTALGAHSGFGLVDERVLPASNPVAQASVVARDRFSGQDSSPIQVVLTGADQSELSDYVSALSKTPHIVRVQSALGLTTNGMTDHRAAAAFSAYVKGDQQRVVAISDVISRSTEGATLIDSVRAVSLTGASALVGGMAADYHDTLSAIAQRVPVLLLYVFVATMVLLFLFTGSVLLPLKAFVLNILTLAATFGVSSWIFVDGHLKSLVGEFTNMETVELSMFLIIAVVTYGLSMDYELFLLARIKELHDAGRSTIDSVALGLQRSGRIITAAALILAVNFLPMLTSGVTTIKMLGVGLGFAILFDATVVRSLLVPALMRLFGRANWWAPRWLRRVYQVAGLRD